MTQNTMTQDAPVLAFSKFALPGDRTSVDAELAILSWRDQVDAAGLHAPDSVYEQLLAETPDLNHPMCLFLKGILAGRAFSPVEITGDETIEFG